MALRKMERRTQLCMVIITSNTNVEKGQAAKKSLFCWKEPLKMRKKKMKNGTIAHLSRKLCYFQSISSELKEKDEIAA
jgi:hypothetical protein